MSKYIVKLSPIQHPIFMVVDLPILLPNTEETRLRLKIELEYKML